MTIQKVNTIPVRPETRNSLRSLLDGSFYEKIFDLTEDIMTKRLEYIRYFTNIKNISVMFVLDIRTFNYEIYSLIDNFVCDRLRGIMNVSFQELINDNTKS